MRAVVALLQRQEFGAVGLAADLPVLAGKTQRSLDGIRTAGGEEGAHHTFGGEPL